MCVFAVVTTVDDKPPTASQETEQPSVPVHTGKFCSIITLLLCYLVFSLNHLLPFWLWEVSELHPSYVAIFLCKQSIIAVALHSLLFHQKIQDVKIQDIRWSINYVGGFFLGCDGGIFKSRKKKHAVVHFKGNAEPNGGLERLRRGRVDGEVGFLRRHIPLQPHHASAAG